MKNVQLVKHHRIKKQLDGFDGEEVPADVEHKPPVRKYGVVVNLYLRKPAL